MEHAAFDPMLTPVQMQELGRLTVNFGYAELLLDWILTMALAVKTHASTEALITPLATRRKLELLQDALPLCPNDEAKALLKSAASRINKINGDRNHIFHGYWAHRNGLGVCAFSSKKSSRSQIGANNVQLMADEIAIATRELYSAYDILHGKVPDCDFPHILIPNEHRPGEYSIIVRPQPNVLEP